MGAAVSGLFSGIWCWHPPGIITLTRPRTVADTQSSFPMCQTRRLRMARVLALGRLTGSLDWSVVSLEIRFTDFQKWWVLRLREVK